MEAVRDRYASQLDAYATAMHWWATTQGLVELSRCLPTLAVLDDEAIEDMAEQLGRQSLGGMLPRAVPA